MTNEAASSLERFTVTGNVRSDRHLWRHVLE